MSVPDRFAAPFPSPSGPQIDDRGGWEPPPTPFPVVDNPVEETP